MKSNLINYMVKLQNMADYLVRGKILVSVHGDMAIKLIDNELTKQRNAFSVQEYNMYDILETKNLGEQKSFGILMECIENGEYERQIEGIIDFNEKYLPEEANKESYDRIMKRVKTVLRQMSISLTFGTHIPLKDYDFNSLKRGYLEEEEQELYREEVVGDLMYDAMRDCFCVVNLKGEIIIEEIDFNEGMWYYNEFLIEVEQDELTRKALEKFDPNNEEQRDKKQHQQETDRQSPQTGQIQKKKPSEEQEK